MRKSQPYAKKIAHKAIWVGPSLLAEIEYRAKSAEGKVSHLQRHSGGLMMWPTVARHTAVAIGTTFIVGVFVYAAAQLIALGL